MPYYSRKSPRHQNHDYTSPGVYFVTICTKGREHFFGEIVHGKMILNKLGKYTTNHWNHITDHYPFVITDTFVCIPNHIHGILIIGENDTVGTQFLASGNITNTRSNNRTYKNTSLQNNIQPKSGSLGAIIRGFKIGITKYAKQKNIFFGRQPRYHDHIIRNEKEYDRIKHYIETNPQNRPEDTFYT